MATISVFLDNTAIIHVQKMIRATVCEQLSAWTHGANVVFANFSAELRGMYRVHNDSVIGRKCLDIVARENEHVECDSYLVHGDAYDVPLWHLRIESRRFQVICQFPRPLLEERHTIRRLIQVALALIPLNVPVYVVESILNVCLSVTYCESVKNRYDAPLLFALLFDPCEDLELFADVRTNVEKRFHKKKIQVLHDIYRRFADKTSEIEEREESLDDKTV